MPSTSNRSTCCSPSPAHIAAIIQSRKRSSRYSLGQFSPFADVGWLLAATMLGDSTLTLRPTVHCDSALRRDGTNREFMAWLARTVEPYLPVSLTDKVRNIKGKDVRVWSLRTGVCPHLSMWEAAWYLPRSAEQARRQKIIARELVATYFTLESLIIWICDDGTRRQGAGFLIGTYAFGSRDLQWIQSFLREHLQVEAVINGSGCLAFSQRATADILARTSLRPAGMHYKFGETFVAHGNCGGDHWNAKMSAEDAEKIRPLLLGDRPAAERELANLNYSRPQEYADRLLRGKAWRKTIALPPPVEKTCAYCGTNPIAKGRTRYCSAICTSAADKDRIKLDRLGKRGPIPAALRIYCLACRERGDDYWAKSNLAKHLEKEHRMNVREYRLIYGEGAPTIRSSERRRMSEQAQANLHVLNG